MSHLSSSLINRLGKKKVPDVRDFLGRKYNQVESGKKRSLSKVSMLHFKGPVDKVL